MNGNPFGDDGHPTPPSLIGALSDSMKRRSKPPQLSDAWRRTLGILLVAFSLASLATAAGAWLMTRRIERRIAELQLAAGEAARGRERLSAVAQVYAAPDMESVLRLLSRHLPADVRLIAATKPEGCCLRITIRTSDPDALRDRLRADPWLERFAERGQGASPDGRIDMILERRS